MKFSVHTREWEQSVHVKLDPVNCIILKENILGNHKWILIKIGLSNNSDKAKNNDLLGNHKEDSKEILCYLSSHMA